MKAGALTPATRHVLGVGADVAHRSMKAGALTPATPTYRWTSRWFPVTLNEGGGSHPRNAAPDEDFAVCGVFRSMKAGALTPATLQASQHPPGELERSMKAGALTPATHTPGCPRPPPSPTLNEGGGSHPRNAGPVVLLGVPVDARSMKAGALTPATLLDDEGRRQISDDAQ